MPLVQETSIMGKAFLFVVLLAMVTSNASAGYVMNSFLGTGDDVLKDNSVGELASKNLGDQTHIIVGDIFQGIVRIDQNIQGNPYTAGANDQLIFAYSFTVAAGTHGATFDLAPTTTAGFTLADMLPTQIPVNVPGSIFAVLDGSSPINPTTLALPAAELALDNTAVYSLDVIGGINAANSDFLGAKLDTTDLTVLVGLRPTASFGSERGGLSVLLNNTSHKFHDAVKVTDYTFAVSIHEIGYGASLFGPSTDQFANGYLFSDSTNVEVNVTVAPEPASMIMCGLGIGITGIVAYRRRRIASGCERPVWNA
jgi:hypothetical protein